MSKKRVILRSFLAALLVAFMLAGWVLFTSGGREVLVAQTLAYLESRYQAKVSYKEVILTGSTLTFSDLKMRKPILFQAESVVINFDLLSRIVSAVEFYGLNFKYENYSLTANRSKVTMMPSGREIDTINAEVICLSGPFAAQADHIAVEVGGQLIANSQVDAIRIDKASLQYRLNTNDTANTQGVDPQIYTPAWFASLFQPLLSAPIPFNRLSLSQADMTLEQEGGSRMTLPLQNMEVEALNNRLQRLVWDMEPASFNTEEMSGELRLIGALTPDKLQIEQAWIKLPQSRLEVRRHGLVFGAKTIPLSVHVQQLKLETLLKRMKQQANSNAVLAGVIDIAFTQEGLIVKPSTLRSVGGRYLAITSPLDDSRQESLSLVNRLLTDFTYESLSLDLAYTPQRSMVKLNLLGHNPEVYEGRDIDLNINLQGDIVSLILSNMQLLNMQRYIE